MVGLIVGAFLGLPAGAGAGPIVNVMQPCDCPPTHYSDLHVLTPVLYRWAAWCQGPCRYTFAKRWHPEIAPNDYFNNYRCPSVNPLAFSINHYLGIAGSPPCSMYQSPQENQPPPKQQQAQQGPQLLPPPKEDTGK
jgi:hypothetical protein